MKNPWTAFLGTKGAASATNEYILPQDRAPIELFNERASEDHRIRLNLLPEPFIGRLEAKVLLLSLNPGYEPEDDCRHKKESFIERVQTNLEGNPLHPFYLLDPELQHRTNYWDKKLRSLKERLVTDLGDQGKAIQAMSHNLLLVEYFPYHSKKYKPTGGVLKSQKFGFHLVQEAIKDGKLILLLRSKTLWLKAVPELGAYGRVRYAKNPMAMTVSPGNFKEEYFEEVFAELKG